MAHVGEWVFAPEADDRLSRDDVSFTINCFRHYFPDHHDPARLLAFLSARESAATFIEQCFASVDWSRYAVVGFTSSFQQTMASLALARRIKRAHPHILIVFGGANCQDEMGIELHRQYKFIDAVCLGEGERAFPELVRRHLAGEALEGIPGMVVRRDGATVVPPATRDPTFALDALPYPDFDDFFAQRAAIPATRSFAPAVVFETARGCWWGAKHHCTFCGLNGVTMAYRSKSQRRAFEELDYLVRRYNCRDVANADNILDMAYFQDFVPRLAASDLDLLIYYETKANLKPEQIAALARAGIRKIQAGIETLSTELLQRMRKGSTRLQNVQTMKLAAEQGVYVEWLALHGFPGETASQYDSIASLIPKLRHLQPPAAFLRARADRFSPYFTAPKSFGVALEPLPAYQYIFPFAPDVVRRLAYHFEMRSTELDRSPQYAAGAAREYALWRRHQGESALWCEGDGNEMIVHEQRWGWPDGMTRLHGAAAALAAFCWRIASWPQVIATLAPAHGEAALEQAAADLEARGWLLREGRSLLMLPLRQPGWRRAPSWEEIRQAVGVPLATEAAA
jgi:ribosomal peptide maturation radical SAM protein 1